MLYSFIRPLLFKFDPELAHETVLRIAALNPILGALTGIKRDSRLQVKIGNTNWNFPIGLAAGVDKNAEALNFFEAQGFGAIECGTVTLRPQAGNPKPRIFRYPKKESLRNSMGFPNLGLLHLYPKVKYKTINSPLGVNIGKNKDSTPEASIEELVLIYTTLAEYADYFVINISSPNTPGLRALQETNYLKDLFRELEEHRHETPKDLYLKLSPDLADHKIIEIADLASEFNLSGIILTNTTIIESMGSGGVSGKLLKDLAEQKRKMLLSHKSNLEIIGVGGVSSIDDLFAFWKLGGKVMQIYTSYIYQGPDILKSIQKSILQFLDKNKLYSLEDFFKLKLSDRIKMIDQFILDKNFEH